MKADVPSRGSHCMSGSGWWQLMMINDSDNWQLMTMTIDNDWRWRWLQTCPPEGHTAVRIGWEGGSSPSMGSHSTAVHWKCTAMHEFGDTFGAPRSHLTVHPHCAACRLQHLCPVQEVCHTSKALAQNQQFGYIVFTKCTKCKSQFPRYSHCALQNIHDIHTVRFKVSKMCNCCDKGSCWQIWGGDGRQITKLYTVQSSLWRIYTL